MIKMNNLQTMLVKTGDHELSSFYLNKLLDQYPSHLPPTSHLKDYSLALSGKCGEITEARKKIKVKV